MTNSETRGSSINPESLPFGQWSYQRTISSSSCARLVAEIKLARRLRPRLVIPRPDDQLLVLPRQFAAAVRHQALIIADRAFDKQAVSGDQMKCRDRDVGVALA
jgi:hypothetical protein